jgi:enoyl-CoA hydratase
MYWQRIQTEILARFGVITIDYPPANAMSYQTIKELDEAVRSFLKMDKVKTFIITGAGKYFVAGADISELQALTPITAGEFNELTMRMLSSIANSPKPVICAINGMALGGGLELALACDIRLTAAEALELGIVEHVVPSKSLMEETTKLAGIIAEKGAVALRAAKRAIMEGIEMPLTQALELEQELFSELLGTEDKAEGTAAFLERRPPRFMDR